MNVEVLRQTCPGAEPYWEAFSYDGPLNISVAELLEVLNERDPLVNMEGERTRRIQWECSCMEGLCGACAVVVNRAPVLACETFLSELPEETLRIQPLQKFMTISDLLVDRTSIGEHLRAEGVFLKEYEPGKGKDHDLQYSVAKCLKCGLCLEVCPNYGNGKVFYGAVFANDCYLVASRNRSRQKDMKRTYGTHVGAACSKSFSCMEVCPVGIPTLSAMAKLNKKRNL